MEAGSKLRFGIKLLPELNRCSAAENQSPDSGVNHEDFWEVKIPESEYYNWRFDQLYVNGKRATLARTPNEGFFEIGGVKQDIWIQGTGRVAEKAGQVLSFDEKSFAPLLDITDEEVELVRFHAYHKWDFTVSYLDKIDSDSSRGCLDRVYEQKGPKQAAKYHLNIHYFA